MRVSKATVADHRKKILSAASRMLRERGIEGASVADLMQAAGLTHGGFYRHFPSKEALVVEATTATFDALIARLEEWSTESGHAAALAKYVGEYLTPRHVEKPEIGCPIAAYGGEVARENPEVRSAFNAGVDRLLAWIAGGLAGAEADKKERAVELLVLMVGAIVTARAVSEKTRVRTVLQAARRRAEALAAKRD
jgi:TetR/AcrR family transcriptional repressor of nem operon